MTRDITSNIVTEVTKTGADIVQPVFFFKAEFDSSDVRFWTGVGPKTYDSEVYTGLGDLAGVTVIEETARLRAAGVKFTLNGLDATLISLAESEDYQNRPVTLWLAFLDSDLAIVTDPYQIFQGRLDVMEIEEDSQYATVEVTAENVLVTLERANERRWTHEDQQITYPGDNFFDQVNKLQEAEVVWR